jgi:hypothetical protein
MIGSTTGRRRGQRTLKEQTKTNQKGNQSELKTAGAKILPY